MPHSIISAVFHCVSTLLLHCLSVPALVLQASCRRPWGGGSTGGCATARAARRACWACGPLAPSPSSTTTTQVLLASPKETSCRLQPKSVKPTHCRSEAPSWFSVAMAFSRSHCVLLRYPLACHWPGSGALLLLDPVAAHLRPGTAPLKCWACPYFSRRLDTEPLAVPGQPHRGGVRLHTDAPGHALRLLRPLGGRRAGRDHQHAHQDPALEQAQQPLQGAADATAVTTS